MTLDTDVLDIIKRDGPISVKQISAQLRAEEKKIRSSIDRMRYQGEPIWNDRARGFWWRNDQRPSNILYSRWIRDFDG